MRYITGHSQHIYKTKASALRAARNVIGRTHVVEAQEITNRFEGCITITADMTSVAACEGGWRWSCTFPLADVVVRIRNTDGSIGEARYADVAHWKDACTPCDDAKHKAACMAADYWHAQEVAESDEQRREVFDGVMPDLMTLCKEAGVELGDMLGACRAVEDALLSDNPHYIAEVILRVTPLGLASDKVHLHLLRMAARRGCSSLECLFLAGKKLSQAAA